jgi:integrase
MAKAKITKRAVDAVQAGQRDEFLWDTDLTGFGLKVSPAGGKTYIFQYRLARPGEARSTAPRRYTIGRHGALAPDQARELAHKLAAMVATGIDPFELEAERRAAKDLARNEAEQRARIESDLAFDRYSPLWLADYEHEKGRRPSSVRLATGIVGNHLMPAFKSKPMPHIDRADLQKVLDAIPPKQKALRRAVYAYASVLFGWAVKRGDIAANPIDTMGKPEAPKARERVLADAELAKILQASLTDAVFGPFYRLLILTGQRRAEVAGMDWSELDKSAAIWTIPADRAKNGVAHIVPLSASALAELESIANARADAKNDDNAEDKGEWPNGGPVLTTNGKTAISGFSKAKRALDASIATAANNGPLPDWRIHDIRRTVATGFQRLGIRFEVTEAVLNHVSGARSGVAGIYQRHDWKDEKRAALDVWARHVASIMMPAEQGNVVPLNAAKKSA